MKATLVVNGKEFPIEINDPKLIEEITSKKKTGYERQTDGCYWFSISRNYVESAYDGCCGFDDDCYEFANYYSDETVAQNNTRADTLMRKLRRFAVEQRKDQLYWTREYCNEKWSIEYDCRNKRLRSDKNWDVHKAFVIYFDTEEAVNLAIETFHDELIWYFTEYKDSL